MELKTKAGIAVVVVATSFAVGRYSKPETVRIETKTVEVEKKTEDKKTDEKQKRHRDVKIVETTKPDGSKERTVTVVEDTNKDKTTDTAKTDATSKKSDDKEVTVSGYDKVTISALAGYDIANHRPAYGASVTKPILGPITVGLWGLSNASCGVSVGLTF